ncbi:MAG: hypothetical protein RLZZ611_2265 [Cyanobacteriota bacterium]|jgi:rSAM-associated Gly-rich repeat protein
MKLITCSRLFGVLLIAASLPFDPGVVLAAQAASAVLADPAPPGSMEARLQRIAAAVQEQSGDGEAGSGRLDEKAISYLVIGPDGIGWRNGGWGNGGFYNGGFGNGGFGNGGFYNGGFRNGGFRNGGFYNGGFRNGGFRNFW